VNVAVELAGAGTRRETVSGGSVRPGVHGPLMRPVLIPASRAVRDPDAPSRRATVRYRPR